MIYNPQSLWPYARLQLRWLYAFDCVGLLLGILAILPRLPQANGRPFLAMLASIGLVVWFFRAREDRRIRVRRSAFDQLEVPASAALLTLIASALLRSYYSGTALVLFVIVWTSWLILGRLSFKHYAPALRVLLVGDCRLGQELGTVEQLRLSTASAPPEHFDTWDIALIDSTRVYSEDWLQWLTHADIAGVKVMSALSFNEAVTGRISTEVLHGRWAPLVLHGHSLYTPLKRCFDVLATLLLFPLLLPLAAIVALVVYLDGGRPVFYWQERVGLGGVPFKMVKFRSMRRDSEINGAAFAVQNDLRVTKVGAFLRKYRLDELPQFYNVMRGEMSIIGPRPEQQVFVNLFSQDIPLYAIRHHVRPGITGWAQVRQGYAAGTEEAREKLRCDFYYIKNFSLALDVRIIGETIWTILSGFGAR